MLSYISLNPALKLSQRFAEYTSAHLSFTSDNLVSDDNDEWCAHGASRWNKVWLGAVSLAFCFPLRQLAANWLPWLGRFRMALMYLHGPSSPRAGDVESKLYRRFAWMYYVCVDVLPKDSSPSHQFALQVWYSLVICLDCTGSFAYCTRCLLKLYDTVRASKLQLANSCRGECQQVSARTQDGALWP